MAEPTQILFSHREVVEALLRKEGIREGIWGIFIKFGITGANVGMTPSDVMPAAIVPVLQIGLQKFDEENNIAVDAANIGLKAGGGEPQQKAGAQSGTTRQAAK